LGRGQDVLHAMLQFAVTLELVQVFPEPPVWAELQ
jgi:hypothetical protein